MLGYTKPLYILPFDHKTSLIKKLFGFDYFHLSTDEKALIVESREITYAGFEYAVAKGIPKDTVAILTDEEFGESVLKDARQKGYVVMLTTERSGQEVFVFEYDDIAAHIEKFQPDFLKALIRYNPEDDINLNKEQVARLKILSDYAHAHGYKFLIEPLVPATEVQLAEVFGKIETYDREIRPRLTVEMIEDLRNGGVEPDVWKLEGMSEKGDYELVVDKVREGDRRGVGVVVLGRGGQKEKVEHWVGLGAEVEGVIGFAVGRTVFFESLKNWFEKKISKEEASKEIGNNFFHFYQIFTDAKSK